MMETDIVKLQYPIGRFTVPTDVSEDEVKQAIVRIALFPSRIMETVRQIPPDLLDTPYRPGGWTFRQVVHHCADSHMNAMIRFKLALTEDAPVIKPYDQAAWAELSDSRLGPEISLILLGAVHKRWVALMETMTDADWNKTFIHPEYNRVQTLRQTVMLYAWHGEHHHGHILNAKATL
jgi:DinB superfamily